MAFWIKKPSEDDETLAAEESAPKKGGKGEESKQQIKRIDNLRIPERLRVHLKSIGTQNFYTFWTKDLSATGAFVLCQEFKNYPFQTSSTIIDATVELKNPDTQEVTELSFLAKIARVVEAHGAGAASISGFGIRIVQMDFRERQVLEAFISSHGKPDLSAPKTPPPAEKKPKQYSLDFEGGIGSQPEENKEEKNPVSPVDDAG